MFAGGLAKQVADFVRRSCCNVSESETIAVSVSKSEERQLSILQVGACFPEFSTACFLVHRRKKEKSTQSV